jgi:hypothetical protein
MKNLLILFLLGLGAFHYHLKTTRKIGLGDWISREVATRFYKTTASPAGETPVVEARKFKVLLLPARVKVKSILGTSPLTLSCRAFAEKVFDLELTGYNQKGSPHYLFVRDIPRFPSDCEILDPEFKPVEKHYFEQCFASNQVMLSAPEEKCVSALLLLRGALVNVVLGPGVKWESLELLEWTDLLHFATRSPFLFGAVSKPGLVRELGERILREEPGQVLALKALFGARLENWKVYKDTIPVTEQAAYWEEMKLFLKRMRQGGIEPSLLTNMELAVETRGFELVLLKKAVEALSGNAPETGARKAFLNAFLLWKQGEAGAALEQVRSAMQLAPNDPFYADLFRKLSQPNSGEEVFLQALQVGVTEADFEKL